VTDESPASPTSPASADECSTAFAALRLVVTSDAIVKMVQAGTLEGRRVGSGRGRYLIRTSQVEEERRVRLTRLRAVDEIGSEAQLQQRIVELESELRVAREDLIRMRAALESEMVASNAHLDAVRQFVVPISPS